MSIYASTAAPTSKRKRWTKRKVAFVATISTVLLAPIAAYAAVQIFGFGQIDSAAAATLNLNVDSNSAQLVHTLAPGQTVGAKVAVNNPNDFPVKVTSVLIQDSSLHGQGTGCDESTLHPVGVAGPAYPGAGGGTSTKLTSDPVTIAGGTSVWVNVPQAVKQDVTANAMCGVKAKFAVTAEPVSAS
jgi:hypothetical protein